MELFMELAALTEVDKFNGTCCSDSSIAEQGKLDETCCSGLSTAEQGKLDETCCRGLSSAGSRISTLSLSWVMFSKIPSISPCNASTTWPRSISTSFSFAFSCACSSSLLDSFLASSSENSCSFRVFRADASRSSFAFSAAALSTSAAASLL
uniref:Uncharacterized protein n=1 Tax=Arundo donax TaxID=35708 RepID=A0A0A9H3K4_ARUDO